MESSLLTAAALIALAGVVFHGVVSGKVYTGHIRASELMPLTLVPESCLLADVHDLSGGEWRDPAVRGDEARPRCVHPYAGI